jgi:RNA polymerase sigma-70 factor, ECF subfamily
MSAGSGQFRPLNVGDVTRNRTRKIERRSVATFSVSPGRPSPPTFDSMQPGASGSTEDASFARYVSYMPLIRRVLSRRLGSDTDVPDLLQEVLFLAWRRADQLQNPQGLTSWLGTTAWLVAHGRVRQLRRQRQTLQILTDGPLPTADPGDFEARESLRLVQGLLARMREHERKVFELRFVEGLSLLEIGQACDVSLGTVKRRLTRAQTAFAKAALREPALARRLERGRARNYMPPPSPPAPPAPGLGIGSQTGA